ncbi:MAG TPA: hypothetical protein VFO10_09530 [Oligoflexus sp.]|uniref:hypothetical protein n=1 Tax=Oligoflexus sp. TaxID=1971216 RepID=UPI002D7E2D2D|nr:hypothetical protein [Oligoflexus sp.]HET9237479.1 hypothetical protein [Oligoflexus sp.]
MKITSKIKEWLNQEQASGTRRFLQMTTLILGGIMAMGLGVALVGVILVTSPLITVLVIAFLGVYGIVSLVKS